MHGHGLPAFSSSATQRGVKICWCEGITRAAVQFIESSISGVRAAYLRLSAGPSSAEVCLLPMLHVGAPSYFAAVKEKLDACDVVLFEGVRTFHSWLLTRSYAIATHRKRLGLVLQRDALRTASLKPPGR